MRTYDPKKSSLIIAGLVVSGYAEGSSIKVKWNNPELFKRHIGGHGEVTRTKRVDTSGTIELSLMQLSPTHAQLHLLRKLEGTFPVLHQYNGELNFNAAAAAAWIEKMPDEEFGTEVSKRDWIIGIEDMSLITI